MAKARKQDRIRLLGTARRSRSALMVSTALQAVAVMVLSVPARAQPVPNARPAGGVVVGGTSAISQTANNTAINQSSARTAINWQSFNVGSQQSVTFQQPNAQSVALNSVTGPNPSQIAGKITANGQIVLVNQSGVTFFKGAQVNTGGLMVSAAGANAKQFMAGGRIAFDQPGDPNARIVNNGNISIQGAGLAALVAPGVANAGHINARLGHVVLAGAKTSTLDLYGDKLVTVNVTGAVTRAPDGTDALVTNSGVIRADGGTVRLTARAVDGVITNLVSAGGNIQARTVGAKQGRITIDGVGGSITIDGNLDATGRAPGTKGGSIGLLATNAVIVKSAAVVDASGAAGGGSIAVGTTLKRAAGGPSVTGAAMAKGVLIEQGATIAANATVKGNGGRVTVLSSKATAMHGAIATKGGPAGGDGGFVEVSGAALSLTGSVDRGAPKGKAGTLLLDPTNLNIVDADSSGSNIDSLFTGNTLASGAADGSPPPSTLTSTRINSLSGNGNGDVVIQATGSIDFQNTTTSIAVTQGLTVQAGGDLLIDRGVTIASLATLSLSSGSANLITFGASGGAVAPASVSAAAMVLNAGTNGIDIRDSAVTATGAATVNAGGGGVSQGAAGVLNVGTLFSDSGVTGTVNLAGTANAVTSIGSLAVLGANNSFTLAGGANLAINGTLTAPNAVALNLGGTSAITVAGSIGAGTVVSVASGSGGIALNSGGAVTGPAIQMSGSTGGIALAGSLGQAGGTVDLTSTGAVTQAATSIITAATLLSSGGVANGMTLTAGTNTVGTVGAFTAASGAIALKDTGTLTVAGTLLASNGEVYLESSNAAGITLTSGGVLRSNGGGAGAKIVAIRADRLTGVGVTGALGQIDTNGGTFQLMANTASGSTTLGAAGSLLSLTNFTGITATTLVLGAVTVPGGSPASNNGAIAIAGAAGFDLGGRVLDLEGSGAVTQTAPLLNAGSLTGRASSAVLNNASNTVTSVVAFNAAGGTFSLVDATPTLTVTGVQGSVVSVSNTGTIAVLANNSATSGFTLAADAGIVLNTGSVLSAPTIDVSSSAGGITQTASSTIFATTVLRSTGGVTGTVNLAGTANAIGSVSSFAVAGAGNDFILAAAGTLAISGPLTALRDVVLTTDSGGGIIATGSVGAGRTLSAVAGAGGIALNNGAIFTGPTVILTSGTGGIALTGNAALGQTGAVVDLTASGGGVSEAASNRVIAATLQSTAGITGTVNLQGTANAIASVGTFAVTGANADFSLVDTGNLAIGGNLTATRDIALRNSGANAITAAGSIGAGRTLALTSGGGGVALNSGAILTGSTIILNGNTGGIALNGTAVLGQAGVIVDLTTGGGSVTEANTSTIVAGTLLSAGGITGAVSLTGANTIASIGSLSVLGSGNSFLLNDNGNLSVAGPLTATQDVLISTGGAGAITVTGSIGAQRSLAAGSGTGGIALNGGAILTGPTIILSGKTGGIALTGNASLGQTGGIVDLRTSGGGVTEAASSTIVAGTLRSLTGITGPLTLAGTSNAIASIGTLTVQGPNNDFSLVSTGSLAISGPIAAPRDVLISTPGGAITATVSIAAGRTLSLDSGGGGIVLDTGAVLTGPAISLEGGVGGISLLGNASAGQAGAAVILNAASGAVTETGSSVIIAGTLTGTAGSYTLTNVGNQIGQIGGGTLIATIGTLAVVDSIALTTVGTVSATAGNVLLNAGTNALTFGNGASVIAVAGGTIALETGSLVNLGLAGATGRAGTTGGVFELSPVSGGTIALSGTAGAPPLTLSDLTGINAGLVRIGSVGGTVLAAAITGVATFNARGVSLELDATGPVAQGAGAPLLNVATLTGSAASYALGNLANTITVFAGTGAAGGLTAATGDIVIADAVASTVGGKIAAAAGNAFMEQAAGTSLTFVSGGSLLASNTGTVVLVTDLLTVNPGGSIAIGGTRVGTVGVVPAALVEIAPRSTTVSVGLGAGGALSLNAAALGAISASQLRIGGYHDVTAGGTNTVTAPTIDIGAPVTLGTSVVPSLRFDANGAITQTGGALSVGTLSASTNGAAGDIILSNGANAIGVLGNVTAPLGDFVFADHSGAAAILTAPATSTIYAKNVAITNNGSIVLSGNIGACETVPVLGTVVVTASTGDITVNAPGLIGAQGAAMLAATAGNVIQNGGLINARNVSITAGQTIAQNGGAIAGLNTAGTATAVVLTAGSLVSQAPGASIASNSQVSVTAASIVIGGSLVSVGAGTLLASTGGTISVNGGVVAAGGNLSLRGATEVDLAGGTVVAGGTLAIGTSLVPIGTLTNTGGTGVLGGYEVITNAQVSVGPLPNYNGRVTVTVGGTTVDCVCTGAVIPGQAPGTGAGVPAAPAIGPFAPFPYLINVTQGIIQIAHLVRANWVEFHSTDTTVVAGAVRGSTTEIVGGTIVADYLTGTSAGKVVLGDPRTGAAPVNQVKLVGPYQAAAGDFTLNNSVSLGVTGTVSASSGQTLLLSAPALTVDHTGGNNVITDGTTSQTVVSAGLLMAAPVIASGTVTPGNIILQTDTLVLSAGTGGAAAPNGVVVLAADGQVAIAPYTTGAAISLGGTTGGLTLTQATLNAVNTVGTSAGTAGTETLILGSLDGVTSLASAIDINTGISLSGSGANGIARDLVLMGTGPVIEAGSGTLSLIALTGSSGAGVQLGDPNAISELGNVVSRSVSGTAWVTSGTEPASAFNLTAAAGNVIVNDTALSVTPALAVVGTVSAAGAAGAPGTIALAARGIQIIKGSATLASGTTLAAGTITSAGSLVVSASTISGGTITPALIQLRTDRLNIRSTGTAGLVTAPYGLVAIVPLTAGNAISIDTTAAQIGVTVPVAPTVTLSLGATDLTLIDTLSNPPGSAPALGPAGTQTLSLGRAYLDNTGAVINGGTVLANGIAITAPVALGGTANKAANTLALYSGTGDIQETPLGATPAGALSVNTLIGTVATGNIYLNGTNTFATLGNPGTVGGFTTPGGSTAGLVASGNVLISDRQGLNVAGPVTGGTPHANYVEIDAAIVSPGTLTVLSGATVSAGNAFLRAGGGTSGSVTVAAGGEVLAANGEADLVAGTGYIAAAPPGAPQTTNFGLGTSGSILIAGGIDGGTVGLYAVNDVTEPGHIGAGLLIGAAGGVASLPGSNGPVEPTTNVIADVGFTTGLDFFLRDGVSLAVVTGAGVTTGEGRTVTIAVAPPAGTAADLVIASQISTSGNTITPTGTVNLEATGNVYEAPPINGAGTRIVNSGGTFTVIGGAILTGTLNSQAGVIPDTETGGNVAGTIPGAPVSRAIDWFSNPNLVRTLGNVTSTGNFLFYDTLGLTVGGTVVAGAAAPAVAAAAAPIYGVTPGISAGEFGTTFNSGSVPFAEIDVLRATAGNLTIGDTGMVHAGIDGVSIGNVTLRAGNSTTAGFVTVGTSAVAPGAGVFAANGGTASISAGFDPTLAPSSAYVTSGNSIASGIMIFGTVWGDRSGATPGLAGTVALNAAGSIDEIGTVSAIGAGTLTGQAGWHANLGQVAFVGSGGTAYAQGSTGSLNQIANVGTFAVNVFHDDAQGFFLRDGHALAVIGPVMNKGAANSLGIAISVAPSGRTGYVAGDLTLSNDISTVATSTAAAVSLQATGNIVQQGTGAITANTLIVQAGAVPDTESGGNTPGSVPPGVTFTAVATLNHANNSVLNLGNASRGVTTTSDFSLANTGSLTVRNTIISTGGNVTLTDTGSVTNLSSIFANVGNGTIVASGNIQNAGLLRTRTEHNLTPANALLQAGGSITNGAVIADGNATLNAGTFIVNGGVVSAGGNAALTAGTSIDSGGTVAAAANASLVAGTAISNGGTVAAGNNATLAAGTSLTIGVIGSVIALNAATLSAGLTLTPQIANAINIGGLVRAATVIANAAGTITELGTASGVVSETGTVIAGLLTGSAGGFVDLRGPGTPTANQIAALGPFDSNTNPAFTPVSGFVLRDGRSLTVSGPVNDHAAGTASGVSLSVVQPGTTTPYGAADLVINSAISADPSLGTARLEATGNVLQTGGIITAGTLVVQAGQIPDTEGSFGHTPGSPLVLGGLSTAGSIILPDANAFRTLGSASAAGNITLADTVGLNIGGTSGGAITAGGTFALTDTGALTINPSATIAVGTTITQGQINIVDLGDATIAGVIISTGTAAANTIRTSGRLSVPGTVTAVSGLTITTGDSLTVAGTIASLTGTIGIPDAGPFTVTGLVSGTAGVVVQTTGPMTVAGSIASSSGPVTITDQGALTVSGTVSGQGGVAIVARGDVSDSGGIVSDGGLVSIDDTGALNIAGRVAGRLGVTIADRGDMTFGPASSIIAGPAPNPPINIADNAAINITGNGSGNATLAGLVSATGTVAITTAGTLSVPGTVIATNGGTIVTGGAMSVAGTIVSSAGTIGIADSGPLTVSGNVNGRNGVAIVARGDMAVGGGIVSDGGAVGIDDTGALNVAGRIAGLTGVTIMTPGPMSDSGSISSAAGRVTITDQGALTVGGGVSGRTGVTIAAGGDMSVAGSIVSDGGMVSITDTGALNIAGRVNGQSGVTISDQGNMSFGRGSSIIAGPSPNASINITDNGSGNVTMAGFVNATESVSINDGGIFSLTASSTIIARNAIMISDPGNPITLGGLIQAPRIVVDNPGGTTTVLDGTRITTSGIARPPSLPVTNEDSQLPSGKNTTSNGLYVTTALFRDNGTLTVSGKPSVVRIDASQAIQLGAGLVAPDSWLIFALTNGATASGPLNVAAFDVTLTGPPGNANLTGVVANTPGTGAAGLSNIAPNFNGNFRINACPIHSVNCVLLTFQILPQASPLRDFVFGSIFNPADEDDLLLPLVSDQVY